MPEPPVSSPAIYQLRVVLRGVSPLVWRRLLVSGETPLAELHDILQLAFAWSDEHLHRLLIQGTAYGLPRLGGLAFRDDARRVPLSRFRLHRGERFRYEYDFTADWKLDLRLERVFFDPMCALPSCTGGSRAAPPESCAGPWAYLQRLEEHKSHLPLEELSLLAEALQRWLDAGGDRHALGDLDEFREAVDRVEAYGAFQPDRFDRRALNRQLRALAHDREVRP